MVPTGLLLTLFCCFALQASANVEKVIFVAHAAEPLPTDASIDNLLLTPLSETYPSTRTFINASFPTEDRPKGLESWFLLIGLKPGRRYEVRICWLATQPTSFWLYTHSVDHVFESTELITSLSSYAYAQHDQLNSKDLQELRARKPKVELTGSAMLFLQIFAAADYFSLNQTLMDNVPPVAVDLILDPFIFNVLPKSLLPISLYLVIIAIGAWYLSGWISKVLTAPRNHANSDIGSKKAL